MALVIAPTRELVAQIAKEAKAFAKPLGINALAVFGGSGGCTCTHKYTWPADGTSRHVRIRVWCVRGNLRGRYGLCEGAGGCMCS